MRKTGHFQIHLEDGPGGGAGTPGYRHSKGQRLKSTASGGTRVLAGRANQWGGEGGRRQTDGGGLH